MRANTAESEGGGITSLQGVSLRLAPPWPLTLVVQDAQLQRYNAIFAVLLQVTTLSCHALACWTAKITATEMPSLRWENHHLRSCSKHQVYELMCRFTWDTRH